MAKVLVVDDAAYVRRWCREVLTAAGHEVLEAVDGAEGVRAFEAGRPDVVVLDVTMPRKDGLTALAEIRRADPNARVLLLTARGDVNAVLEARRLGALAYVLKPAESTRLLEAISRALSPA